MTSFTKRRGSQKDGSEMSSPITSFFNLPAASVPRHIPPTAERRHPSFVSMHSQSHKCRPSRPPDPRQCFSLIWLVIPSASYPWTFRPEATVVLQAVLSHPGFFANAALPECLTERGACHLRTAQNLDDTRPGEVSLIMDGEPQIRADFS